MQKERIVGYVAALCLIVPMVSVPAHAQSWELEVSDGCTLHQAQGEMTVVLSGDEKITVFGFSKPAFRRLYRSTRVAYDVYFDGPSLKGRENLWGTVEMGVAPIHSTMALIFVPTPSFLKNLVQQSSVTFQRVDNPNDKTTLQLSGMAMGMDILETCRRPEVK